MANTHIETLPPMRIGRRHSVTLRHDLAGLALTSATAYYDNGAVEVAGTATNFRPPVLVPTTGGTGLWQTVFQPTYAGKCTIVLIDSTASHVSTHSFDVKLSEEWEERYHCRKEAFSLLRNQQAESGAGTVTGGSATEVIFVCGAEDDAVTAVKEATRKYYTAQAAGLVYKVIWDTGAVDIQDGSAPEIEYVQFAVVEWNGTNWIIKALSEKIGPTGGDRNIAADEGVSGGGAWATGEHTFFLSRPMPILPGQYPAFCTTWTSAGAINFVAAHTPTNVECRRGTGAELGAIGATVTAATNAALGPDLAYFIQSPDIAYAGSSNEKGSGTASPFETTEGITAIDNTLNPAYWTARSMGVESWVNGAVGGTSISTISSTLAAQVTNWEPAIVFIQPISLNDVVAQSSSMSGWSTWMTTLFGDSGILQALRVAGVRPIFFDPATPIKSTIDASVYGATWGTHALLVDELERIRKRLLPLYRSRAVSMAPRREIAGRDLSGRGENNMLDAMTNLMSDSVHLAGDGTRASAIVAALVAAQPPPVGVEGALNSYDTAAIVAGGLGRPSEH